MMRPVFFLKGLLIGFSIAAPVGPIGLLRIQRTVAFGRKSGFVSGLGAATADGFYGIVAGFGLTAVSALLISLQLWVRLVGGAFLLYLGIKTFLSAPATSTAKLEYRGLISDYASTMFLTLTNPVTILSFVAVFAGVGLVSSKRDFTSAIALVAGVVSGSALWWLVLSGGISLFSARFTAGSLKAVNRVAGAILVAFALVAFGSTLRISR
jgi:threonine/homoserine/homoserine lactone efflux protein